MKRILMTSAVLATSLFIVGCGGGDSVPDSEPSETVYEVKGSWEGGCIPAEAASSAAYRSTRTYVTFDGKKALQKQTNGYNDYECNDFSSVISLYDYDYYLGYDIEDENGNPMKEFDFVSLVNNKITYSMLGTIGGRLQIADRYEEPSTGETAAATEGAAASSSPSSIPGETYDTRLNSISNASVYARLQGDIPGGDTGVNPDAEKVIGHWQTECTFDESANVIISSEFTADGVYRKSTKIFGSDDDDCTGEIIGENTDPEATYFVGEKTTGINGEATSKLNFTYSGGSVTYTMVTFPTSGSSHIIATDNVGATGEAPGTSPGSRLNSFDDSPIYIKR